MFAPPSVANAKATQAFQATVFSPLATTPAQAKMFSDQTPAAEKETCDTNYSGSIPQEAASNERDCFPPRSELTDVSTAESNVQQKEETPKYPAIVKTEQQSTPEPTTPSPFGENLTDAPSSGRSSAVGAPSESSGKKKNKKNRRNAWYNLMSSTYKSKCDDFRRLFKEVPETEMLIVDYSCALQRDILVHGRLYVTQNYLCFYANIFRWETTVVLKCKDITSMTKEKTALVIPNAIQCSTEKGDRYFFTSFAARDKSYLMLFRIWQNALLSQPMTAAECWRWIHYSYGDELGLSSDDEDYIAPDDITGCSEIPVEQAEMASVRTLSENRLDKKNDGNKSFGTSCVISEDNKSTSSDDQNTECEDCSNGHDMKQYLNKTFELDIDHAFTCLFTASEFYQELQTGRKIINLAIGSWEQSNDGTVKQERIITYSVSLSLAKNCLTTEKQRLLRLSKPGLKYAVSCEINNSGVPYADCFVVHNHICMTTDHKNSCRVRLFSTIEFKKEPWGFMKSIIERNTFQGLVDFATDLEKAFDKEAQRMASETGQSIPKLPDVTISSKSREVPASAARRVATGEVPVPFLKRASFILLSIVAALLLLNLLYSMTSPRGILDGDPETDESPLTVDQWRALHQKTKVLHRRQLKELKMLIERSLEGFKNMNTLLRNVEEKIGAYLARSSAVQGREDL